MYSRASSYLSYLGHEPVRCVRDSVRAVAARLMRRNALHDGLPWMPWAAIDGLRQIVRPGIRVFEYGAGGSTIFLARHGAEVWTVEHDPGWGGRVAERARDLGLSSLQLQMIAPEDGEVEGFESDVADYEGKNFREYVQSIAAFKDGHFDLVIVDGRASNSCVRACLPKIRGGIGAG